MSELVVLGCSETKRPSSAPLPAIELYDGPMYRVLRSHLRSNAWPSGVSLAILSAEYGLIGGLARIDSYERRMSPDRARHLLPSVSDTLDRWAGSHHSVRLIMGRDYLPAIEAPARRAYGRVLVARGMIGEKLHSLSRFLGRRAVERREPAEPTVPGRLTYFLPDWDDFVDADFDFDQDEFSSSVKSERRERHLIPLMRPHKLADGVVVSLAQQMSSKGLLKAIDRRSERALRPRDVRSHFALQETQLAFGDCGAFSYVSEPDPPLSPATAASLYNLYGFDLGASVDHIPAALVHDADGKHYLDRKERLRRIRITRSNAHLFISETRSRGYRFTPVGVVQGIDPADYARQLPEYLEMGYSHLAIGGLVPRSDAQILDIVQRCAAVLRKQKRRPWVHLFGVFRPKLQGLFREHGMNSFDSATYLRKAWLRSNQNYLSTDGRWYAALRVPVSSDPRTAKRLRAAGVSEKEAGRLEREALESLLRYADGAKSAPSTVNRVLAYDGLLERADDSHDSLRASYLRTLRDRPWESCSCRVCRDIGIHVVIFRGLNRNKRRGAHNTLMLYGNVKSPAPVKCEQPQG